MKILFEEKARITSLLSREYQTALKEAQSGEFAAIMRLRGIRELYGKLKSRAVLTGTDLTGTYVDVELTDDDLGAIATLKRSES